MLFLSIHLYFFSSPIWWNSSFSFPRIPTFACLRKQYSFFFLKRNPNSNLKLLYSIVALLFVFLVFDLHTKNRLACRSFQIPEAKAQQDTLKIYEWEHDIVIISLFYKLISHKLMHSLINLVASMDMLPYYREL